MRALGAVLENIGYAEVYGAVVEGSVVARDAAAARRRTGRLVPPERDLVMALAFGDKVCLSAAGEGMTPEAVPGLVELIEALVEAGLALAWEGAWQTAGWVVVPNKGGYLIVDRFVSYGGEEPRVYLGDDSLMFSGLISVRKGARVLDLATGCGIYAVLASDGASHVVATDIDERAVRFCALNVELNESTARLAHPVSVRRGDLYAPVGEEQFDLIVTLAPYVPSIGGAVGVEEGRADVPFFANGGTDGLALIRRILEGLPEHLAPGGEFVALMQLLLDREGCPIVAGDIRRVIDGTPFGSSPAARLTLSRFHSPWPYALELAQMLDYGRTAPHPASADLAAKLVESWRAMGVAGVATGILRIWDTRERLESVPAERERAGSVPSGSQAGERWLCRTPGEFRVIAAGSWWSPRDVPRLANGVELVASEGGMAMRDDSRNIANLLDPAVGRLVAEFDGVRTVSEAVGVAWPEGDPGRQLSLVDVAIERCRDLEVEGLLMRAVEG